ncbi:MAG TPA: SPOR domain-containing protein [Bacteroidales bacterium]|nr:SPOR domain-containing protein [Bacteroidales bacterium]
MKKYLQLARDSWSRKFKYLCILLLMGGAISAFPQTQGVLGKRFFDNWSVGIGAGPDIFFGDLKATGFFPVTSNMNEVKYGGTFTLTRQFSHVFAIRGQFLYSEISGTKRTHRFGAPCDEYFDGNILEGNLNAMFIISNLLAIRDKPQRKFFLYGTIGIGTSGWNSKVKQLGTGLPLRVSDIPGNWTMAMMGLIGVGAYFNLHDKVNLGIEWTDHVVNSDGLDATPGGFRYDAYSMVSLTLTYNFNRYNPRKLPDTSRYIAPVQVIAEPPAPEVKPVEAKPQVIVPAKDTTSVDTVPKPKKLPVVQEPKKIIPAPAGHEITYRVQIFAFRTEKYTAREVREKYHLSEEVYKDFSDGWFRYTVGACSSIAEARALQLKLNKRGFQEAFIARFKNGIRVPLHDKK